MKRIKILTISSSGFNDNDGISTVLYDYYKRFDLNKFELHLIVPGRYSPDIISRFENIGINLQYFPSRKKKLMPYFIKLILLVKQEKYDIVYIHGSSALMAIDMLAATISGCKCRIVHSHNTKCNYKRLDIFLRPLLYSLCTVSFACGNDAGRWLFGNRPFRVIRNGRSLSQYKYNSEERLQMRKKLALTEGCLAIGHVGNFNEQKNQVFLVHVFAEVLKRQPNAMLFFIGDGSTRKMTQETAEKLGINNQVIFVGMTNDVPKFLQAMDVMALPSLHEGLPLVVVEWQLAGLPCLVSDTVTRECSFTNLVQYKSLDSGSSIWADCLLEMSNKSFSREDVTIEKKAKEAGFDIDTDAIELQNIFMELLKRTSRT